jgi:hypothetical protein
MWRRQRLWPLLLFAAGVVFSITTLVSRHGILDQNSLVWLAYIPCALIFGAALMVYRRRSYVQVTDSGLRVSNLLSALVISYEQIRSARVQPLERHFQDNPRSLRRPGVSELKLKPALFVRLRGEESELAQIRRKLGSQLAHDDTIAVPLPDPDAMAWEISSRLPERPVTNLGGQRRRKRSR